jgi:hypothetical protein
MTPTLACGPPPAMRRVRRGFLSSTAMRGLQQQQFAVARRRQRFARRHAEQLAFEALLVGRDDQRVLAGVGARELAQVHHRRIAAHRGHAGLGADQPGAVDRVRPERADQRLRQFVEHDLLAVGGGERPFAQDPCVAVLEDGDLAHGQRVADRFGRRRRRLRGGRSEQQGEREQRRQVAHGGAPT